MAKPDYARVTTQVFTQEDSKTQLNLIWPYNSIEDSEPEDAVLHMQGFLCKKDLPPIVQNDQLPSKLFRATQSVKLTGLGSPTFAEAVKGVIAIHQLFAQHLDKGMLIPWSPIREHDELVLEFSNRYLSCMRDMEDDNEIPIGNDIDPFGILRSRI
ncbi:hypothetical protein SCP_0802560 [Sparassis crispa]|uniref:Uncharacterized protein n=1 Tax=Sparassis crispa TaxID=139825 RepID=A0A401GVF8_9APHY|nr:hypothetical protein SCP_0802560 [Sparassis crispa]GBE85734.1 hypothetical protein SCP_0802560 [Sparassis crispa]